VSIGPYANWPRASAIRLTHLNPDIRLARREMSLIPTDARPTGVIRTTYSMTTTTMTSCQTKTSEAKAPGACAAGVAGRGRGRTARNRGRRGSTSAAQPPSRARWRPRRRRSCWGNRRDVRRTPPPCTPDLRQRQSHVAEVSYAGNMEMLMLVLTILLAAMALVTLGVVLGQFLLQRTTAGGRNMLLLKGRLGIQTFHESTGSRTNAYRVDVGVAGPGVWHEVVVHLEVDGNEFDPGGSRPELRRASMDCESEPITWNLNITKQVASEAWCVVTWAAPRGPVLRSEAVATPLGGGGTYRWRWFVGSRYLGRLSKFASSHGPGGFATDSGAPDLLADGGSPVTTRCATVMVRSDLGVRRGRDGDPTRSFGPVGNAPSLWTAPRRERGGPDCWTRARPTRFRAIDWRDGSPHDRFAPQRRRGLPRSA
jgi:hypothetical protein